MQLMKKASLVAPASRPLLGFCLSERACANTAARPRLARPVIDARHHLH